MPLSNDLANLIAFACEATLYGNFPYSCRYLPADHGHQAPMPFFSSFLSLLSPKGVTRLITSCIPSSSSTVSSSCVARPTLQSSSTISTPPWYIPAPCFLFPCFLTICHRGKPVSMALQMRPSHSLAQTPSCPSLTSSVTWSSSIAAGCCMHKLP